MVGLLLLKQLENLSDEVVVERWTQNPYYQYFCGVEEFQWDLPCDPTDLVYFRERVGQEGVHLILSVTANMHKKELREKEIVVDTTVLMAASAWNLKKWMRGVSFFHVLHRSFEYWQRVQTMTYRILFADA